MASNWLIEMAGPGIWRTMVVITTASISDATGVPDFRKNVASEGTNGSIALISGSVVSCVPVMRMPILDEDGYEASIYLDKFPELAPWIKGEGHSIIVTKGQDSEERIISEVYQISFSYPALIAVPYIRCIPANNGSISFACVRREFTYISTQSRLYQQGIDRLITETFKLAHPLEPRTQEVMP